MILNCFHSYYQSVHPKTQSWPLPIAWKNVLHMGHWAKKRLMLARLNLSERCNGWDALLKLVVVMVMVSWGMVLRVRAG